MIDSKLLEILVCPGCRHQLTAGEQYLACTNCQLEYPIEAGIPVLLLGEARPLRPVRPA